ncbi:MAG: hypothetical protein AVDCRST_MAG59-2007, partial [uncultured Thermomicrobiales bacterium]
RERRPVLPRWCPRGPDEPLDQFLASRPVVGWQVAVAPRDDLVPPLLGHGDDQEQLGCAGTQQGIPLEQHLAMRLVVQAADLVDRDHARRPALERPNDRDGELGLRHLVPRGRGRRARVARQPDDPTDEDVRGVGGQGAVILGVERVDRMRDADLAAAVAFGGDDRICALPARQRAPGGCQQQPDGDDAEDRRSHHGVPRRHTRTPRTARSATLDGRRRIDPGRPSCRRRAPANRWRQG